MTDLPDHRTGDVADPAIGTDSDRPITPANLTPAPVELADFDPERVHKHSCGNSPATDTCNCLPDLYSLADRLALVLSATEPYEPPGIREVVKSLTYKPGWYAWIEKFYAGERAVAWALHIVSDTEDSLNPGQRIRVNHEFLIPPADYKPEVWRAWVLDRLGDVEDHERNEFARFHGERLFAPHHGNGEDPYRTWHHGDMLAAAKRAGDD